MPETDETTRGRRRYRRVAGATQHRITARIRADLADQLEAEVAETGTTKAAIVEDALDRHYRARALEDHAT